MENRSEPHFKKSSCSYCGDAPVHHGLFYFDSLLSNIVEPHMAWVAGKAPEFLKKFADWLPVFTFKTFALVGLAKFSNDTSRANTFRSKVIWEEAKRRGIRMEQLILFGKPVEYYRAFLSHKNNKEIFFQSLPVPPERMEFKKEWDNKFVLKEELKSLDIPVPNYMLLTRSNEKNLANIFEKLEKPLIVKPKLGSRGRHTITNIQTMDDLEKAIKIARVISPFPIVEEHIDGYVCRITLVEGKIAGFYRGESPKVTGDGVRTVRELIQEKDAKRPERVEKVYISDELREHVRRRGFSFEDVLPKGLELPLSHRVGRLFGGATREMLDDIHPSFVPYFEKAARATELAVAGFDAIIPNPEKPASEQRWGIIECNTLPFIDLHYYALEGKPKNIAGMLWDLWS